MKKLLMILIMMIVTTQGLKANEKKESIVNSIVNKKIKSFILGVIPLEGIHNELIKNKSEINKYDASEIKLLLDEISERTYALDKKILDEKSKEAPCKFKLQDYKNDYARLDDMFLIINGNSKIKNNKN